MAGSPEVRLKRFLHYGSELPFYNASRSLLKFTDKSCPSIHTLIAAGKEKEVGLQIIKAHSDGYAVHREALLHAMALCALNKTASSLREMTYNAVKTVCVKPEDFFLFVTYLHDLNNSKINSGNGLKRAISDWYLKKDVMEFAEIVSKKKGYYRWTHVDLMKIAHIKTDDPAKQAVIQFVFSGGNMKELREKFKNVKEAQPVLQYLKVAAEVRTSNDAKMVSRAIESNSLTVSHLPQHNKNVMYSDEVWCSLMTGMPLEEMLDQLQFVSRHQLLRPARGCTRNLTRRYCDAVSNVKTLAESNVHPARVLIELSTYNLIAKEKIGLATKLKHTTAIRKPPPTNEQIIEELTKVMDSAFKLLVPTGQSYVVAIDTRSKMWVKRCWKNRYVTCADAAALLALSVVRCERDVTVGMYAGANSPFKVVEVAKDTTLSALVAHMKKHQQDELAVDTADTTSTTEAATTTTTNVDNTMKLLAACINDSMKTQIASQMLDWAEQNKRSVDVFLALGDNQLSTLNLATKLNHYRSVMRLQNAKLVHVHLNGPAKCEAKSKGSGILAVHGFDKNVPRVIEAFARGAF